ncbi:dTDP-4-dehydrorhamnose 3,5-epimerase [Thauera sp. UPWRP]|nr:dTDP-4-dehydrorhamnose 3,5-epimerase [Thauera sp. UPWRP]
MKLTPTAIPDLVLIEPAVFEDERGWFMESFNEQRFRAELRKLGLPLPRPFVQDNHSCSKKGVLRGLHYQRPPHAQGKLVRVVQGAAFDVALDIREDSPTFGKWVGAELSANNRRMLWIPEGFAHGFVALEDDTHFLYKTTDYYAKECEAAIRADDSALAISWPSGIRYLRNAKDEEAPTFDAAPRWQAECLAQASGH